MHLSRLRVLAICIFRHGERILVAPGRDQVKEQRFFRPLGGEVEFGETAVHALRREIREELGLEIEEPVQLGVLENHFEYRGQPGHEVVFVFDACFADARVYDESLVPMQEPGWEGPAEWLDISKAVEVPVYPAGLLALLRPAQIERI